MYRKTQRCKNSIMSESLSQIDKYIYEAEAEEIGGTLLFFYGEQGSAKTTGLWNCAKIDLENQRIPLWRGQSSCQWIGLAANNLPVTLWIHDTVTEYEFFLKGDRRKGIESKQVELEEAEDVDIQIKRFSDAEELVNKLDPDRANVYIVPGDKRERKEDRYFFYNFHKNLFAALNNRRYGDHICYYVDEVGDVLPPETQQPFYQLITFVMPKEFGNLRKNNVSFKGTEHSQSSIFHKFRDKSNNSVYFSGANVKHKSVDQGVVNNLKRGHFVIPGFEKDHFKQPYMPDETISWIPENSNIELKMSYDAEIPNVVPDSDSITEKYFDDKPFEKSHLDEIIDVSEAEDLTGISRRGVAKALQTGRWPGMKLDGKWFLSMSQIVNHEDIPIRD